ncbi:MAG: polysaccharide deacetylase family protein [Gammaproteobacteria bacterium]|nr:polysaccharide deacetylase family protein [Gammaproteobacteria bacterium]
MSAGLSPSSPELIVRLPGGFREERRYAAEVVLEVLLGLTVIFDEEVAEATTIRIRGLEGEVCVADRFFAHERDWLRSASIPQPPYPEWDPSEAGLDTRLVTDGLPILFRFDDSVKTLVQRSGPRTDLNLDVFGTAFFLLTGYEELADPAVDRLDRYPYSASVLRHQKLIERPLVDEYAELLFTVMRQTWPSLPRATRTYTVVPSHDVDVPFTHAFTALPRMLLSCGADWVRRRDLTGPFRRARSWWLTKRGDPSADPANTFDLLMDLSEEAGLRSEFNFIVDHSSPAMDGNYDIRHPWILEIIRRVHQRGHRVGLHCSYNSFEDSQQIAREIEILKRVSEELGIDQETWHSRQHWLRWHNPNTLQALADAGIDLDCTMTFETHCGFRRGTSHRFPAFNLLTREKLSLWQQPLLVMDATLLDGYAMDLGFGDEPREIIDSLAKRVRLFGGEFTILWHNSRLTTSAELELYRDAIDILSAY